MPTRNPKIQIWEVFGLPLGPQNQKKTAKMWFRNGLGSNLSKNTFLGRSWAGCTLENQAPVSAGARFPRNRSPEKACNFDIICWCLFGTWIHKNSNFGAPWNSLKFQSPVFGKDLKTTPTWKWERLFHVLPNFFSTLFFRSWSPDGVPGGLQNAPEVVFNRFGHRFYIIFWCF